MSSSILKHFQQSDEPMLSHWSSLMGHAPARWWQNADIPWLACLWLCLGEFWECETAAALLEALCLSDILIFSLLKQAASIFDTCMCGDVMSCSLF